MDQNLRKLVRHAPQMRRKLRRIPESDRRELGNFIGYLEDLRAGKSVQEAYAARYGETLFEEKK